jgi:short-subunit dehydrogenase
LNVSSIASLMPVPKLSVYAATKAYVTSFSEGLRAELRGTGVSVTALCPGPVDTEFFSLAERGNPDDSIHTPEFFKVPVGQVAREALHAVQRDRARVIPGWLVATVMTLAALVPIFVLRVFLPGRGTARPLTR